jgi:hypothetical protein
VVDLALEPRINSRRLRRSGIFTAEPKVDVATPANSILEVIQNVIERQTDSFDIACS